MTKNKRELQQVTIKGIITATSNKQSADFVTENPRKTAYVTVDETNKQILLDNGLTEYTSKEDGVSFFIIKLSEEIDLWINGENSKLDTRTSTPNFTTTEEVRIAMIKGWNKGNDFVRIFALGLKNDTSIEIVEKTNPFADSEVEDFNPISPDNIPF